MQLDTEVAGIANFGNKVKSYNLQPIFNFSIINSLHVSIVSYTHINIYYIHIDLMNVAHIL